MVNGALLERVGSGLLPIEQLSDIRETFQTENLHLGARFLDLGGDRPQIKTYLSVLEKSFIFAASTGFVSMIVVMLVSIDFSLSWNGETSWLPPLLAVFLGLTAFCLTIVAVYSCLVSIKYLKQTVREVCKT